jgi:hypothetical protein
MSIPTQNIAYLQQGPVASGQQFASSGLEQLELSFLGTVTFTLDGAATSSTLNYIDGTQALNFTPRAVLLVRIGGNGLASIVAFAVDNANGGVSAAVTFSAAGTNTNTLIYAVAVMK